MLEIMPNGLVPGGAFINLVFSTSSGDPTTVATNPEAKADEIWSGLPSGIPKLWFNVYLI